MKKWLSLLLAVVMVLGLSACDGQSENDQTTDFGTKVRKTLKVNSR